MDIHTEQNNVGALCDVADFLDSGFQSFCEQVRLPKRQLAEAAFFAGAALALKANDHFATATEKYGEDAYFHLKQLLVDEINQYMGRHHIVLEWEPHVPTKEKQ